MKYCKFKTYFTFDESVIKIEFFKREFRLIFEDIANKITIKSIDFGKIIIDKCINACNGIEHSDYSIFIKMDSGFLRIETTTDKSVMFRNNNELINAFRTILKIIELMRIWYIS